MEKEKHMDEHPTIEGKEPGPKGRGLVATWGFYNDEPTMALFVGETDQPVLIPLGYLMAVLKDRA